MRRTTEWAVVLSVIVTFTRVSDGSAQRVRGQIVDSVSNAGVPSGFVVLLDRDRTEVARALADREGRFTLTAPRAGTYRLRSERIGFRALTSGAFTLQPDSTLDYVLTVSALPVRLADLAFSGETACRALGEQQAALAVWDEARKALAAVAWGQKGRLRFELRLQDRNLFANLQVQNERVRTVSGTATRPFSTPTPAEIGKVGYVRPLPDGGRVFDGPDAQILFSNEFLTQHCFRVLASTETRGLIGLAFEPVRNRRLPDIAGTIWVDDASAELKYVEYRYVNHGLAGVDREATGRVEFEPLADGYWIVRRWRIRLPVVEAVKETAQTEGRSMTVTTRAVIASYVENGGEVLRASADGMVLAARSGASTVVARVTDRQNRPVAGVALQFEGTAYQGTTSTDGLIRLSDVAEGAYLVKYTHPMVPALGPIIAPGLVVAAEPGRDTTFEFVLPDILSLLDQTCPGRKTVERHSALAGGVRTIPGLGPVTGFKVKVEFPRWTISTLGGTTIATSMWEAIETESSAAGNYLACDLPPDRPATLYALSGTSQRVIATLNVLPDTIHQRNLGVAGDSVFVR